MARTRSTHKKEYALRLTKRSHHFLLTEMDADALKVIMEFARTLIQYGRARRGSPSAKMPLRVFATATKDRSEFRFHINYLSDFLRLLKQKGYGTEVEAVSRRVLVEEEPFYEPAKVQTVKIKDYFVPKPDQVGAIKYLKTFDQGHRTKLLALRTGAGKSYSAMQAAEDLGVRNVYLMRPAFMDNWIKNFVKTYEQGTEGNVMVQGRSQLQTLLQLAVDGDLNYDNIVISNKTFQYWLKDYEDFGEKMLDMGWPATPDKFTELLGAGILTIDELHLDFHLNYKIFLYTHVNVSFAMTATLETRDPFLSAVYERVQPFRERYQSKSFNLYIEAFAYMYQFENMSNVQTSEHGSDDYSHNAFERWIMRDKDRMEGYFEMINSLVQTDYLNVRSPGESMLIFCSSVKMCQLLSEWLQKRYKEEIVEYFIAGGDYTENFLNASIVVSTTGKSGTAVDKEGLRTAVLTISLDSIAGNLQAMGRLREMPSGNTPRFIYFVCKDIDKHVKYHQNKLELLPKYVKSIRTRSHYQPI